MEFAGDRNESKDFRHPNPGFADFVPGSRSSNFLFTSPAAFDGRTSLSPLPPPLRLATFHRPAPSPLPFRTPNTSAQPPGYWLLDAEPRPAPTATPAPAPYWRNTGFRQSHRPLPPSPATSQLRISQPLSEFASNGPGARGQNTPSPLSAGSHRPQTTATAISNRPDLMTTTTTSSSSTDLPSTTQQSRDRSLLDSDGHFLEQPVSRAWASPNLAPRSPAATRHADIRFPRHEHEPVHASPAISARSGQKSSNDSARAGETGTRVSSLFGLLNASGNTHTDAPLHSPSRLNLDSSPPVMPAITRGARKRSSGAESTAHPPKRSKTAAAISSRSRVVLEREDLTEPKVALKTEGEDARNRLWTLELEEHDVIDLVDDKVPESLLDTKKDNSTKLSAFQCVICMDNVCALTVTHCGHLFCSECLHSSLHINGRKICPICRQKIDAKPASGKYSSKAKGFYQLELKLMTPKRLGKRKAA